MNKKRLLVRVFAVCFGLYVLAAGCYLAAYLWDRARPAKNPSAAAFSDLSRGVIGSGWLHYAYVENEAAADVKYTGQTFDIEVGDFQIEKVAGEYILYSNPTNPSIRFRFRDGEKANLVKMKPYDGKEYSRIRGRIIGKVPSRQNKEGFFLDVHDARVIFNSGITQVE